MTATSAKVPVGVLVSGGGTNLQALMDACAHPDFPARIALVISNRRGAFGLERARKAGIPALWIPHRGKQRADFDTELVAALHEHGVQWVCCAGFMRILTPVLLDAFENRVLNIHPSLLPAFPGLHAQSQALHHGARIAGATVHLVDAGEDTGPIVCQGATAVLPDDTEDSLQQRILAVEHVLFPRALRWAVQDRLTVDGRTVQIDLPAGGQPWVWMPPQP